MTVFSADSLLRQIPLNKCKPWYPSTLGTGIFYLAVLSLTARHRNFVNCTSTEYGTLLSKHNFRFNILYGFLVDCLWSIQIYLECKLLSIRIKANAHLYPIFGLCLAVPPPLYVPPPSARSSPKRGYSLWTPTSATPASSPLASRPPPEYAFIAPGIESVETGFRSCNMSKYAISKPSSGGDNLELSYDYVGVSSRWDQLRHNGLFIKGNPFQDCDNTNWDWPLRVVIHLSIECRSVNPLKSQVYELRHFQSFFRLLLEKHD